MEETPIYLIIRDTDLDGLQDTVNERIDEGYELAGPLVCVPAAAGQPPIYVQPLTLAAAEEVAEEDDEAEDEDEDDDEREDEDADAGEDVVVYRRKR